MRPFGATRMAQLRRESDTAPAETTAARPDGRRPEVPLQCTLRRYRCRTTDWHPDVSRRVLLARAGASLVAPLQNRSDEHTAPARRRRNFPPGGARPESF